MITIVIPVYNAEKYLNNTIRSVRKQTYSDWQMILVNDGSVDASLEICNASAERDRRIKVFTQENKGQAVARNFALTHVTTPYVTFLDADDEIAPDTLEENLDILLQHPEIDCLQYPVYYLYGSEKQYIKKGKPELIEADFYRNWLIEKKISWITCDKFFKTELFSGLKYKEGIFFEDNLLLAELLGRIKNIQISNRGMYYYYDRQNSTTTATLSEKREKDSLYVTQRIFLMLKEQGLKEQAVRFLVRVLNIRKSLRVNFAYHDQSLLKQDYSFMAMSDIILSKERLSAKIKLLLLKFFGIG